MRLPWLAPGDPFPPSDSAWGADSDAPGLLAAGGALDVPTLLQAYGSGVFPWFGEGQPLLWWSPDPRMVLEPRSFRLHRSLKQAIRRFRADPQCAVRVDTAFGAVIRACASAPRRGQLGTWIVPDMVRAYEALHAAGHAHSVETWAGGRLVGGLYGVALGAMFFGESMFSRQTDASKIALAALVALGRAQGTPTDDDPAPPSEADHADDARWPRRRDAVELIDCQQNTGHLASLGAREIPRATFLQRLREASSRPGPMWRFEPVYWDALLSPTRPPA